MNNPAITNMLARHNLNSVQSSYDALREILQELVLLALYDAGFYRQAAFYGGTALRVLHQLPRFSEDLDFSLLEPQPEFDITPFKQAIVGTLNSYGFDVSVEIKKKSADTAIASAFIKGNTLEHLINIQTPAAVTNGINKNQAVKIKLEVDTDPPPDFQTEDLIRLVPRAYSIKAFTLPCLFAGKIHAVLCRAWGNRQKGRDWYDLVLYVGKAVKPDLAHLQARLNQNCNYLDRRHTAIPQNLSGNILLELLEQRIEDLDIAKAKADVLPFIHDAKELDMWSHSFFSSVVRRIA